MRSAMRAHNRGLYYVSSCALSSRASSTPTSTNHTKRQIFQCTNLVAGIHLLGEVPAEAGHHTLLVRLRGALK